MSTPSAEQVEEVLLSCRYGELDEVKEFVAAFGWEPLAQARDERENTVLHMCCGNGHLNVLEYIIPNLPKSLLQQCNASGSPPLHWAILNNHVAIVKHLVELPEEQGGGVALLHQTNAAGRDAFTESLWAGEGKEEVAGWIEGYLFKVEGGEDLEPKEGGEDSAEGASPTEDKEQAVNDLGEEVSKFALSQ